MNLLLDTEVALWAIVDSPKLPLIAREMIVAPRTTVWVSAVSLWEIAAKSAVGRGVMPITGQEALGYFEASGYRLLALEAEHAVAVENLPAYHQDPFDRLLVAQALVEPMRLMTNDPQVARYSTSFVKV